MGADRVGYDAQLGMVRPRPFRSLLPSCRDEADLSYWVSVISSLVAIKIVLGINILNFASRRFIGMDARRSEDDEVNDFARPPLGEGEDEKVSRAPSPSSSFSVHPFALTDARLCFLRPGDEGVQPTPSHFARSGGGRSSGLAGDPHRRGSSAAEGGQEEKVDDRGGDEMDDGVCTQLLLASLF